MFISVNSAIVGFTTLWRIEYMLMLQFLSEGLVHTIVTFLPESSVSLFTIRRGSGGPKRKGAFVTKNQ